MFLLNWLVKCALAFSFLLLTLVITYKFFLPYCAGSIANNWCEKNLESTLEFDVVEINNFSLIFRGARLLKIDPLIKERWFEADTVQIEWPFSWEFSSSILTPSLTLERPQLKLPLLPSSLDKVIKKISHNKTAHKFTFKPKIFFHKGLMVFSSKDEKKYHFEGRYLGPASAYFLFHNNEEEKFILSVEDSAISTHLSRADLSFLSEIGHFFHFVNTPRLLAGQLSGDLFFEFSDEIKIYGKLLGKNIVVNNYDTPLISAPAFSLVLEGKEALFSFPEGGAITMIKELPIPFSTAGGSVNLQNRTIACQLSPLLQLKEKEGEDEKKTVVNGSWHYGSASDLPTIVISSELFHGNLIHSEKGKFGVNCTLQFQSIIDLFFPELKRKIASALLEPVETVHIESVVMAGGDTPFFAEGLLSINGCKEKFPFEWAFSPRVPSLTAFPQRRLSALLYSMKHKGQIACRGLFLDKWLLPVFEEEMEVTAAVDAVVSIAGSTGRIDYFVKDALVDHPHFSLQIPSLHGGEDGTKPAYLSYNFDSGAEEGFFFLCDGSYRSKKESFCLEGVSGGFEIKDKKVASNELMGFFQGLVFSNQLEADYSKYDQSIFSLNIFSNSIQGELGQMAPFLQKRSFPLPHHGSVSVKNKGFALQAHFSPDNFTFETSLQGALSNGKIGRIGEDVVVEQLSCDFSYDHSSRCYTFSDIQGTILAPAIAEKNEEFALSGGYIRAASFPDENIVFDLSINEKEKLAHLIGQVSFKEDSTAFIDFDAQTQIGPLHPDLLQIELENWSTLKKLTLKGSVDLEQLAKMCAAQKLAGSCSVFLEYELEKNRLLYQAAGENLILLDTPVQTMLLKGKKIGSTWSVDQLLLDQLNVASTFAMQEGGIKINFLGLTLGDRFLCGFEGFYCAPANVVNLKINLLQTDLKKIPQLSSYPIEGLLSGEGACSFPLSNWQGAAADIALKLTCFKLGKFFTAEAQELSLSLNAKGNKEASYPNFSGIGIKISSEYLWEDNPLTITLIIPSWEEAKGKLLIIPKESKRGWKDDLLAINWHCNAENNLVIDAIEGTLFGFTSLLKKDGDSSSLFGTVVLDGAAGRHFFSTPPFTFCMLTGGWDIKQEAEAPPSFSFKGMATASDVNLCGLQMKEGSAAVEYDPEKIVLRDVILYKGHSNAKAAIVTLQKKEDGWSIDIPETYCKNIKLPPFCQYSPRLEKKFTFNCHHLALYDIEASTASVDTLKGRGLLAFTNKPKHILKGNLFSKAKTKASHFDFTSGLFMPSRGEIFFAFKEGKIFIEKVAGVVNQQRTKEFFLLEEKKSFLDWQGNLNIYIAVKPVAPLPGEIVFWNLEGTAEKPLVKNRISKTCP